MYVRDYIIEENRTYFREKGAHIMKRENVERGSINYKEEGIKLFRMIRSEKTDERIYKLIERLYLKEEAGK